MASRVPARLSGAEGRRFGLTVGAAFVALAAVVWWRGRGLLSIALLAIGSLLLFAGLVVPGRLGPVFRAWMGLAHLLSRVTAPIVLGVIFFTVVTPVGLLARLLGASPLRRHASGSSSWIPRERDRRPRLDMQRQF